jgi:hypothetical protein
MGGAGIDPTRQLIPPQATRAVEELRADLSRLMEAFADLLNNAKCPCTAYPCPRCEVSIGQSRDLIAEMRRKYSPNEAMRRGQQGDSSEDTQQPRADSA